MQDVYQDTPGQKVYVEKSLRVGVNLFALTGAPGRPPRRKTEPYE